MMNLEIQPQCSRDKTLQLWSDRQDQTFNVKKFSIPKHTPQVALSPLLHNNYVTFGCFNKPEKFNQEVIQVWAKLLRAVLNSKLMLKYRNIYADKAMKSRWMANFKDYGVNSDQLIFLASDDHGGDHLAFYSQIDIALDTFPFDGPTQTFEALLMGVPVITLQNQKSIDRVSTILLNHSSLSRFVTDNSDGYIKIAAKLSSNASKLSELRKNIRKKFLGSRLFDASTCTLQVDKAHNKYDKKIVSNKIF